MSQVRCRSCGGRGPVPQNWPQGVRPTICAPCFSLAHLLAVVSGRQQGYVLGPCRCRTCRAQPWRLGYPAGWQRAHQLARLWVAS